MNSVLSDAGDAPTIKRTRISTAFNSSSSSSIAAGPVDLSSEFLPDQLPAGSDLVHLALPIFLQEPADAFVVKGRAELDCRVAHALSVHFQCNDEVQRQTATEDHVEPATGIRYTQARVQISRDQVEEFFGDYHCACVAVSGQGHSKSRLAYVTIAFLKKEFEVPPYADQSVEGKQVYAHAAKMRIIFPFFSFSVLQQLSLSLQSFGHFHFLFFLSLQFFTTVYCFLNFRFHSTFFYFVSPLLLFVCLYCYTLYTVFKGYLLNVLILFASWSCAVTPRRGSRSPTSTGSRTG